MRLYFLSERTAALKLDGAYLGIIDCFERFVDIGEGQRIFVEAVPDGDAAPVSFFIDDNFFHSPPDFADVYLTDGDAVISLNRYEPRTRKLRVIAQTFFAGRTVTLFENGGAVYLNCEGAECSLYELSRGFENAKLIEENIAGYPVLVVDGDKSLAVISDSGKRVFYNPAESWQCGNDLTVTVAFATCAGCRAECTFNYDGEKMTLTGSVTRESVTPPENVLHFAFFESVLTRGDFRKYLDGELLPGAGALPSFLGEFVDVTIPYSRFYDKHGDIRAAGLVYPIKHNLFEVKYFAVDLKEGKIANIYEVE